MQRPRSGFQHSLRLDSSLHGLLRNLDKVNDHVSLPSGITGNAQQLSPYHYNLNFRSQKKLVDELEQLRAAEKKVKNKKPKTENIELVKKLEYVEPTDEETDDFEDTDKDPDWRATPLFKRIQVRTYIKRA